MKLNKGLLVLAAAFALGLAACNNSAKSESEFVPVSQSDSGETSQSETSSQDTSSEDTSSEEQSSEDASSEDQSSQDASSEDSSSEDSSSSSEGSERPAGAVDMEYSTADNLGEHGDNYVYFNDPEWWSGASARVNEAYTYPENNLVFDFTYLEREAGAEAPQDWSVQILRKNSALTAGKTYTLSFGLKTNRAGTITIQDIDKAVVEGDNEISVEYTEAANASFRFMPSWNKYGSARLVFTNITWEEKAPDVTPFPEGLDIAYAEKTFAFSGEAVKGQLTYWNGEGAEVTAHTYNSTDKLYELTYDQTAAAKFYSVQVFYALPYATQNEKYDVSWTVYSDVAGSISINGAVHAIQEGENVINLFDVTVPGNNRLLDVQLGVNITYPNDFTSLGGTSFKCKAPIVHDKNENTYYEVKFMNGEDVLKDIQVKAGATVVAPADPTPATGLTFTGWFDGENKYTASTAINAAHTYVANFSDSVTLYTVTVMEGANVLKEIEVIAGEQVNLSSVQAWGASFKFFSDSGLATPFDATTAINADTTIYAKRGVAAPGVYNEYDWAYAASTETGEYVASFKGGAFADAWKGQINFENAPVGENGKTYRLTFVYSSDTAFEYKFCKNGGSYDYYGGGSIVIGEQQTATIEFAGGTIDPVNKLTFEVGGLSTDVHHFTIHSLIITVVE